MKNQTGWLSLQEESSELYSTVREILEAKFTNLDSQLVEDLLSIQMQYSSDAVEAKKRTETVINAWVTQRAEEG